MEEMKLEQPNLRLGLLTVEIENWEPAGADAAQLVMPGLLDHIA